MMEIAALITALAAGAFGALAYGYRGQRDQEREQVQWLRKELASMRGSTPPTNDREQASTSRALTSVR